MKGIQLVKNTDPDFVGAASSVLCMIHCIITPFLFAAQATVSTACSEISPTWWKMVDYLFLIITFFAIYYTAKSTLLKWLPNVMYVMWSVLAILLFNKLYHLVSIPHPAIYVPALSLSGLHIYNRHYCRCQKDQCCI